ncbi:MAG: hypothetical protein ABSH51_15550 [Solirubrobacteraceae bacterium]|jgi:hypothetical protein
MPSAKLAVAVGLAALSLSACGVAAKPEAGTPAAIATDHRGVDNPRTKHVVCLRQAGIPVTSTQLTIAGRVVPGMQIGTAPSGPTVAFEPTPGDAQGLQIQGQAQGAEVIGSALVYPNQAPDGLLTEVENCVALGVTG